MTAHKTGTREEWLKARLELLKEEKEMTKRIDEIARRRQALPWVRIDKEYRFETGKETVLLPDLFQGRSQLLVYHFMFGPDFKVGCATCSSIADGFNGIAVHLANHDVMLWAISRAPFAKLDAFKRRWGGRSPGRLRPTVNSTSTSTSNSARNSKTGRALTTTTGASPLGSRRDRSDRGAGPRSRAPRWRQCPEPARLPTRATGRA